MTAGGNVTPITLAKCIAVKSRFVIVFAILLAAPSGHTETASIQSRTLIVGETISDAVSGGETRHYAFHTPGNQNTVVEIVKGD